MDKVKQIKVFKILNFLTRACIVISFITLTTDKDIVWRWVAYIGFILSITYVCIRDSIMEGIQHD